MAKKMSICLLSRYPPLKGGVSVHVQALVKGLKEKGHDITLITYGKLKRKERGTRIIEVPMINLFFLRGLVYLIGAILALRKAREKIDIIHAHPLHPAGTAAVMFKTFSKVPVVVTSHGSDLAKWSKVPLGKAFFSRIANSSDKVICVSDALARRAKDIGIKRKKIMVVPNGIDVPHKIRKASKIRLRQQLRLPEKKKTVLFVGMMEDIKNPQELLEVAKHLKDYLFVFVGGGSLERQMRQYAITNKLGNVRFTGMKDHETALKYIRAADILAVPSKFEGFGIVALEGMMLGTAVVAKPAGALKNLLARESLTKNLKSRIVQVMESKRLRNKIIRKNSKIAEKFNENTMVDEIERIYQTVSKT
ncbi:MAG: glycosyltransferase family 4 protein [Candidatus Aenigmatarchaeota archaeon]